MKTLSFELRNDLAQLRGLYVIKCSCQSHCSKSYYAEGQMDKDGLSLEERLKELCGYVMDSDLVTWEDLESARALAEAFAGEEGYEYDGETPAWFAGEGAYTPALEMVYRSGDMVLELGEYAYEICLADDLMRVGPTPAPAKYRLGISKKIGGRTLYRVIALRDFADVCAGDVGGWIEEPVNLAQAGDAWISDDARVSGKARVLGGSHITEKAQVYGAACVSGKAFIHENAAVGGNARVFRGACLGKDIRISGNVRITGVRR